jgi:hypothetical protein
MRAHEKPQPVDVKKPGRAPGRTPAPAGAAAGSVSPQALVALQRTAGNAAIVQMLRQAGPLGAQEQPQHGAGCRQQQAVPAVQRSAVHDVLRSGGQPLDESTRTEIETRFGADFSDVRLHTGRAAEASAAEVGARAYTSGSDIVLGAGGRDKHTLAHELAHVIQQRQGPVAGTDYGAGLRVSDPNDRFEREAEANATRVMSRPVQRKSPVAEDRSDRAPAAAEVRVQRSPTRGGTGRLPLPAWDRHPPVWGTPAFGPVNPYGGPLARTGGSSVAVTLGPSVNAPGNTYGGSRPGAAECTLVNELNQRDGSGWIKGHLWNDNLGGQGISINLTPMTNSTNQNFNRQFEEPLKKMLLACTRHAQNDSRSSFWYGVTFSVSTYGQMSNNPADLEYFVPEGIEYTASYVQMDRATQAVTPVAAPTGFPLVIT